MIRHASTALALLAAASVIGCRSAVVAPNAASPATAPAWERDNPVRPLPDPPLGSPADWASAKGNVTPEKVRLGRWLFYDRRLSVDGTISCASCHRPENAFSEPTPRSTGVRGQHGTRKAPTFLNGAWPIYDVYFWDGRARSLAEQAKGPIENPVEMGNTHAQVVRTVSSIAGYRPYFRDVYGDDRIDIDRVVDAIAAYEATRMSGGSAFDRFDAGDASALDDLQRLGREVFFEKARCNACHLGPNFTDSRFHNLGIGWAPAIPGAAASSGFADPGRYAVTHDPADTGAFKTPTLRDCTKHAPYMHDGSIATLREVVLHYDRGGTPNPWLDPEIRPLHLTAREIDGLVALMKALDGEGYADTAPRAFPE